MAAFCATEPSNEQADIELEQAVLGSCLSDSAIADQIFAICAPTDFHFPPHPRIAKAVLSMLQDGLVATPLTVGAKIDPAEFGEIGGRNYLDNLKRAAPSGGRLQLARQLVDLRHRREALEACSIAREMLEDRAIPIIQAINPAIKIADNVVSLSERRANIPFPEMVQSVLKAAEDAANGKTIPAVSTGLKTLDAVLGGLQAADLCIYAGRPGMGKSSMLLTTALGAVMAGRPAIIFSLEMTKEQLLHRIGTDIDYMLHPDSPLSYSWFRNGHVKHDQVSRLAEALLQVPDLLEIRDGGDLTIHEISAAARNFRAKHSRMGVVVIDYLQKINAGERYKGNKVQEITEISGASKALAKRLNWPVVAGAQLSRAVENRDGQRPTLSDLRESGAIEQDADSVIGLYRPGYYIDKKKPGSPHDPKYPEWEEEHLLNKNRLDLIVLKNRHGSEDVLSVHCDMRASAIRDEKPMGLR